MTRRSSLELAILAVLVVAAGFSFSPVYSDSVFAPAVVLAGLGSVGLCLLAERWKPGSSAVAVAASTVGYVLVLTNTVLTSTAAFILPTPTTLEELGDGLVNGWARLLTTDIPIAGTTSMLVVGPSLVWLTGHLTAQLAIRSTSSLWPLVPVVALLAVGSYFAGADADGGVALATIVVGLSATFLLVRNQRVAGSSESGEPAVVAGTPWYRRRSIVLGATAIALAVIAGVVAGPELGIFSDRSAHDPRDLDDDPERLAELSPLVLLQSLLRTDPPTAVLRVRTSDVPQNLRLAVLEDFDGVEWTSSNRFENAGTELPDTLESSVPTLELVQDIEIEELAGVWLPAASRPAEVSVTEDRQPQVDPRTGTIIAADGDLAGFEYQVVSEVPVATQEELEAATVGTDPQGAGLSELPIPIGELPLQIYGGLVEHARRLTEEATTPYERLKALESYFAQTEFVLDTGTPSGHSYGHLNHFVFRSKRGSPEQFATAFAVMARALGIPSRVVVGFVPAPPDESGTATITTEEAHAWPEVLFDGIGWLPFEPDPTRNADVDDDTSQSEVEEAPRAELPTLNPAEVVPPGADQELPGKVARETPLALVVALVAGSVVGLGLLFYVVVLNGARLRARRRRRTGSARQQVIGAYHEALDQLSRAGVPSTRRLTSADLVARCEADFDLELATSVQSLGELSNWAIFSPRPPGTDAAERAWADAADVRTSLRRHQTTRQRMRVLVDPRWGARRR